MPYIQLIDGISVDEYIIDPSNTEYVAEGECVIEHANYGTVGLKYDPITDTFDLPELEPADLISFLATEELMALDAIKNTDMVRYKLLNDILTQQHTEDEAFKKFTYVIDAGIMEQGRVIEIIAGTRYDGVVQLLLTAAAYVAPVITKVIIDPPEQV